MIVACTDKEEVRVSATVRPVKSVVVRGGSGIISRSFSGTLQSSRMTSFSFRVSGAIQAIPVAVGETITEGQVIASLDASDYELEAQRAKALLTEANSQLRNANAKYERTKRLYEAGNSSKNDLDNARANAEAAAAAVESARKTVQIAEKNLTYTRLSANGDCKVAAVSMSAGENVVSGTEVVAATCGDSLEVALDIPETFIAYVNKGAHVTVSFPAIADRVYEGVVNEVGVAPISGGTTFPVSIRITAADQTALKAGLSADVLFAIDHSKDEEPFPIVPSFAVHEDERGRFVFLVEKREQGFVVSRTPVEIGELSDEGIEIVSGVRPGQRVVTAGMSTLSDGMPVTVAE